MPTEPRDENLTNDRAHYFITAFEVAQDLANKIRDGSVKIPAMPPELADQETCTYVLHTHQEPDQSLSCRVDVNPMIKQTTSGS